MFSVPVCVGMVRVANVPSIGTGGARRIFPQRRASGLAPVAMRRAVVFSKVRRGCGKDRKQINPAPMSKHRPVAAPLFCGKATTTACPTFFALPHLQQRPLPG